MIRASFTFVLIIIGACAAIQPTPKTYSISDVRTRHIRGTHNQINPELSDP